MSKIPPLTIIDLYSGVGGFSLGAARAGFNIVAAVDNDSIALKVHKINFPNTVHLNIDLSSAAGANLLQEIKYECGQISGVIGGPPCQGFSVIGKNHLDDKRNRQFVHFFRLVSEIRPAFYLCENVLGILHDKYTSTRMEANKYVDGQYVSLPPIILKANDFGAPTSRSRSFFFGYRQELPLSIDTDAFKPPSDVEKITVERALKGLPKRITANERADHGGWRKVSILRKDSFGKRLYSCIPINVGDTTAIRKLHENEKVSGCLGTIHTQHVLERFKSLMPGARDNISKSFRLDPKGYCPTLRAGTGKDHGSYQAVRPIHPTQNRVITPREAARLQGFPDWYQFDSTIWHSFRLIGNSVSPILAEYILSTIRGTLEPSSEA